MDFEIFLPLKIPIRILRTFGLWQTKKSTWSYFFYGIILHVAFVDVFTTLMFSYLFAFKSFEDFANLMTMFPTYLALCLKSINWFYNLNEIESLFDLIEANIKRGTKTETGYMTEKFKKRVMGVHKIFKIFWASAAASCVLGAMVPIFAHELPYRMWFPWTYESGFWLFSLAAIYQVVNTLIYSGVDIVLDTFPVFFMGYILGMLEQLYDRLEAMKKQQSLNPDGTMNENSSDHNSNELIKCIAYQLKILEITRKVEKFFSMVFLIRGLMSMFILCTTSFALTTISPSQQTPIFMKLSTYMIPMLFQIFLPCYYGTEISIMSSKLSTGLFKSDWYRESPQHKSCAKIFLEFVKKPIKISAIGLFEVNLESFTTICNSAYSLYAVFKKV